MKLDPLPNPNVVVDLNRGTIQPETPDGDDFFGLAAGTNGTAATTRRELVIGQLFPRENANRLRWLRSNGRDPAGLRFVPGNRSHEFENPWIPSERDE